MDQWLNNRLNLKDGSSFQSKRWSQWPAGGASSGLDAEACDLSKHFPDEFVILIVSFKFSTAEHSFRKSFVL